MRSDGAVSNPAVNPRWRLPGHPPGHPPGHVITSRTALRPSPVGKAILVVAVILAFLAVATSTSIGPVVALLVVGLADAGVSWWRLHRIRVDIAPLRSVAGPPDHLSCSIEASGRPAPVVVTMVAAPRAAGRVLVDARSGPVTAELLYPRPHCRNHLEYRLTTSAIGLALARRDELLVLGHPLFQGPATADIDPLDPPLAPLEPELERLREYVPGDRWSRISWPTLARTGNLHVRQEDPVVEELVVMVDLKPVLGVEPVTATDVESQLTRTLSLAAAVIAEGLHRNDPVRLVTYEPPSGVFDLELAIAARRVDGRQPKPDPHVAGGDGVVVNELVPDLTEMHRRLAIADVGPMDPPPRPPYVLVNRHGVAFVR